MIEYIVDDEYKPVIMYDDGNTSIMMLDDGTDIFLSSVSGDAHEAGFLGEITLMIKKPNENTIFKRYKLVKTYDL